MTYIYRVLKDGPTALYPMDSSAFIDASGYGRTGSQVTAGFSATRPIVAGGVGGYQFGPTSGARVNYPVPNVMQNGMGGKPFSLEIWAKPDVIAGSSALLARDSSGIYISSLGQLTFSLVFGTTTVTCTSSGLLEAGNPYHIVAVYDTQNAYLYLNGKFAGSADISSDNLLADFADTSTSLRVHVTSGAVVTVDGAAVYTYALSPQTVAAHYAWGTNYPKVAEISAANSANVYRIFDGNSNWKTRLQFDTADEWNSGAFTGGAVVVNDSLTQQFDTTNNVYFAGTWTYSVFLPQEAGVTLSGSRITWDAGITNLNVKVSVNGGAFTTVTNGGSPFNNLSLNAADSEIRIQVTLPSGATAIVVPSITFAAYVTKDIFGTNEDIPALIGDEPNAVLAEYDYEPASFNNNAGVRFLGLNSGFTLPADPEFGSYQAIEFTMLFPAAYGNKGVLTAGAATITANASGLFVGTGLTALYINGVSVANGTATNLATNQIHHIIAVFPATAGPLYLANVAAMNNGIPNLNIGYVATYRKTLTSSDATAIFNAWVGSAAVRLQDANHNNIFEHIYPESGVAFRGYAYTWAISGTT